MSIDCVHHSRKTATDNPYAISTCRMLKSASICGLFHMERLEALP
nr:MAG TPA: hypothetical protein [Caudoviricetes sp.]